MKGIIPCKICNYTPEVISHMSYTNSVDHDLVDFDIIQCSNTLCKWNIYLFLHQKIELEKLFSRNLMEQFIYREAVITCLDFKKNLFYSRQHNEKHFDCVIKLWNIFHSEENCCISSSKDYNTTNILSYLDLDI